MIKSKESLKPLPSPQQLPSADIVIFDGNCVFCTSQVRNLQRLDGGGRLAFLSLHDPFVTQHFPDLTHEQLMEQMYVIPRNERGLSETRLGGAAAIRYLTRRLPRLWILAPLLHVPYSLPLWQWAYDQIARRRYRIANKDGGLCDDEGSCKTHFRE